MRLLAVVLSVAGLLQSSSAFAAEWRYCLAQDEAARKVYVTRPFQTNSTIYLLEAQFSRWLSANEVEASTGGICPRAISPFGPDADIRSAIDYNHGLGLKAVEIDWMPTAQ